MTERRSLVLVVALVLVLAAGVGLYWFQPWKLVADRQVDEARQEHETAGSARVIQDPDGSRALELVGLDTSNGPDLRVWLSDQPVRTGAAGWRVFDDGTWVELGRLKGNRGNQRYVIPAGTDLDEFVSVTIWCKRFSVSFGAASLTAGA